MSWALKNGPYHTHCSPIPEDRTHKQTVVIPLDKAAESLEEAPLPPLPPIKISSRNRALTVLSGLWLLLVFLAALNINVDRRGDIETIGFITGVTVFGIIPIGIAWGVVWILGARRK